MSFIKGLVALILVFGMINLGLWGCQELIYREDTKELNLLEEQLKNKEQELMEMETNIDKRDMNLKQMKIMLVNYKSTGNVNKYNAIAPIYNLELMTHKITIQTYELTVTSYNMKVNKANMLIERTKRWYLIPIPRGKMSKTRIPLK